MDYVTFIGDIIIRVNLFLNSCLYLDGYGVPATPVIFLPDDPQISVVEDEVTVDDDDDDDDDDDHDDDHDDDGDDDGDV